MFSHRVKEVMDREKLVKATPATSVTKAARLMAEQHVGAVAVCEGKRLVGIFTERDALFRVIAEGRDAVATRIGDVMTRDPMTIGPEESFGAALLTMYDNGFRHLPVVENGVPIGMVSTRSALDPDLEEFRCEATRRHAIRRQHRTPPQAGRA